MLTHLSARFRDCQGIHRRDLLKVGVLGGLGPSLDRCYKAQGAKNSTTKTSTASSSDTRGHQPYDTFDPVTDAPKVNAASTVISTANPGVSSPTSCPEWPRVEALFTPAELNPKNHHGVADQYVFPAAGESRTHLPDIWLDRQPSEGSSTMPPFVQLGDNVDRTNGGGKYRPEHNPFVHAIQRGVARHSCRPACDSPHRASPNHVASTDARAPMHLCIPEHSTNTKGGLNLITALKRRPLLKS